MKEKREKKLRRPRRDRLYTNATLSHAQRYLVNMIDKRELRQFSLSTQIFYDYLYAIATDTERSIPFWIIVKLRDYIHPINWFYTEDEELPQKLTYQKKYEKFEIEESVAYVKLDALENIRGWCLSNGVLYNTVYNIIAGYSRPTFFTIKKMKEAINPAQWYIQKDEISG